MKKGWSGLERIPRKDAAEAATSGCLVLEGGAFRGLYEEGVLDALLMDGIRMQCVIGVSAGALNGVNYVAGQIGRSAYLNLKYRHDPRYVGWRALPENEGIIGFDFAFSVMNQEYPLRHAQFERKDLRFVAVATNCLSGKAEYVEKGKCPDIFRAVRASASMPFLSKPVMIGSTPYLDGGCSDRLPFRWAKEQGYARIVVIRTRDPAYRKRVHAMHAFADLYRKYPEFAHALRESNARYNRQCEELEQLRKAGRIFVIAPSVPIKVGRLEGDLDKLEQLYWMGMKDAQRQLPALRKYLNGR